MYQQGSRMAPQWHLRIFGIPELQDAKGRALPFRTKKQLALMVYLTLEAQSRPVSRDLLVDLLWDDVIPERGRHSLSQGCCVIRQHLGRDAVTRGPGAVRLTCRISTDLDRIAADAIIPAESTNPLKELDGVGGGTFAHWLEATRTYCFKAARQLLADQLASARSSGKLAKVYERATELYRIDPYSDTAVHAIAEQSLLDGDTAGAIKLLRTHVNRMAEELQCSPHPDVQRLLKRIEKGVVNVAKPRTTFSVSRIHEQPQIFVGREEELSTLEALWEEARSSSLQTCVITGPAGIGKSTLIRRFAASVASRAWPAWQVSCQEIGVNIPFAAVSELIHVLIREPSVSETDPQWLAEASRVAPTLKTAYPGVPDPPPAVPEAVRIRVAEAIAQMLETAADGGPFLLFFDDTQQMDPASRDVLKVLAKRIARCQVLLLLARRTSIPPADSNTPACHDGPSATAEVCIPPLSKSLALRMIDRSCDGTPDMFPALRETIAQFALGNPYVIEMLISDWKRQGADSLAAAHSRAEYNSAHWEPPEAMRQIFGQQYRSLAADTERVLQLLAVARRKLSVSEIAALLHLPLKSIDQSALDLIRRGIVRVEQSCLCFKNELHRAFVYYAMSSASRSYHHVRLARLLSEQHDETGFQRELEACSHLLDAGMIADAVEAVERSAPAAIAHGAAVEVHHVVRALLHTLGPSQSARLHLLLAQSLLALGDYRSAADTLTNIAEADLTTSRDVAVAHAMQAEALQRGGLADATSVLRIARRACSELSISGTEMDRVNAYQTMAEAAYEAGDDATLIEARTEVSPLVDLESRRPGQALAASTLGYCALVVGDWKGATNFFKRFLRCSHIKPGDPAQVRAINGIGIALAAAGRFRSAETAYKRAFEISERAGNTQGAISTLSNLGVLYDDCAMYSSAAATYRSALKLADSSAAPRRLIELYANIAGLAISLGNIPEAEEFIQLAADHARSSGHRRLTALVNLVKAYCDLARADTEDAWSSIAKVDKLSRGQIGVLDSPGLYWLVKGQQVWTRHGYRTLIQTLDEHAGVIRRCTVTHRLLIELLIDSINSKEGRKSRNRQSPLDRILQKGVFGVISAVIAIGAVPHGLEGPTAGESPGQFVCRIFPTRGAEDVPRSVSEWSHARNAGRLGQEVK